MAGMSNQQRRIVISGAGGLIGSALAASLREEDREVARLVRDPKDAGPDAIHWSWESDEIETDKLEGVEAVVHLAGRNLAASRWTDAEKARVRDSRVRGTELMARTLAKLGRPPRVFVAASDYMKSLPNCISPWIPGRYSVLGTDGFGLSESRDALRRYFEVSPEHIELAALKALGDEGSNSTPAASDLVSELGIDPEKANPADA